jgi:hypothetical protein
MSLETVILSALAKLTVFEGLVFVALSELILFVLKIARLAFCGGQPL